MSDGGSGIKAAARPLIGELFAGIGGFGLGFERAGWECRWQVERNSHCLRVLEQHWPSIERYRDVRAVSGAALEPVDCITFGSPCQDLSIAGSGPRNGLAGLRSGLFFEAIRIIREMREATDGGYPAFAIWENVPGALSSAGGGDFAAALDALAELGALDIAWRVLDAQFFGVAQQRRRIFVVADFGGERAWPILADGARVEGSARSAGITGGGSLHTHHACASTRGYAIGNSSTRFRIKGDLMSTLTRVSAARAITGNPMLVLAYEPMIRRLTPVECERLMGFPDGWTACIGEQRRGEALGNAVVVPVAAWLGARMRGIMNTAA